MHEEEGDMGEAIREAARQRAEEIVRATEPRERAERIVARIHQLAHKPYVAGCEKCDEWREEAAAAGLPD